MQHITCRLFGQVRWAFEGSTACYDDQAPRRESEPVRDRLRRRAECYRHIPDVSAKPARPHSIRGVA